MSSLSIYKGYHWFELAALTGTKLSGPGEYDVRAPRVQMIYSLPTPVEIGASVYINRDNDRMPRHILPETPGVHVFPRQGRIYNSYLSYDAVKEECVLAWEQSADDMTPEERRERFKALSVVEVFGDDGEYNNTDYQPLAIVLMLLEDLTGHELAQIHGYRQNVVHGIIEDLVATKMGGDISRLPAPCDGPLTAKISETA